MDTEAGIVITAIALLGIGAQWLSWWLKLPAILLLLLIGIVAGPVTGLIEPDELFQDLLFPVVSLGVAVILFEGSLTLRLEDVKGLGGAIRNLVTVGALINWLIISAATRFLLETPWGIALLFGALVTVTGPTVIVPMLRTVRPNAKISNILRWEGIIIDPLGALLAVLVFDFLVSRQEGHTVLVLGRTCLVGGIFGTVGALALGNVLRRHLMPEYLHNVATLSVVLGVFATSNTISHESGLIAVTLMGVFLANMKNVSVEDILDFKESLTILLISGLFIVLAARLDFSALESLGLGAFWLLAVVLFVARPLSVWVSTAGSNLTWREKALLSWIAPRGIVAAAVSALFALRLEQLGDENARLLVSLTFAVILGTVIIQSATARRLAAWLKVSEPDPLGILIVGGNPVARAIGKTLLAHGFRVVLADYSWLNTSAARMDGIKTYFGNATSEHADRHLDLVGIGRLLAMSLRPAANELAAVRFRPEFGSNSVYVLETETESTSQKRTLTTPLRAPRLFGEDVTQAKLAGLLSEGAEIRSTSLTENFSFDAYRELYGADAIPLFSLDAKKKLRVFTAEKTLQPASGWTVIALLPKEAVERAEKDRAARGQ